MKASNVHKKSREASSVSPEKGQLNFTGVVARGLRKFNSVVHKRLRQSVVGGGSWKNFWTQSQRITTTFG
jgi:hypothetical protein